MSIKENIGFIGLGSMGKSMAKNLLKAGFPLTVYDIRLEPVEELKGLGASGAASPREVGAKSDIIFVMVLNFPQVESCTFGDDGVLAGMKPGSTLIVTSTIAPSEIKKVAEAAAAKGVNVLDSPVSGGARGAAAGTLTMMVAGSDDVFEACKDALFAVGSNTIKVGNEIGIGQVVKAANQLLVSVHLVAIGEAMVLGTKAGADPEIMYEVIRKSAGNCWMFEDKMPTILEGDFSTRGALDIQIKDLNICLMTGKELNVPLFTSAVAREVFLWANAMGLGRQDASAIIKVFEQVAGVEVRKRSK
ncbi:MAG: NAD(P)-dependent oxidoreductase [Firmicutes bacterium]|nr:NAD(P)-dependent oxidoreductase [Bacillota bacterium]